MTINRRNRHEGFTLIELLIVVAIIGIIAAILIPNFLDALHKGRQKRTLGDFRELGTAVASYYTDNAGAGAAGAAPPVDWATIGDPSANIATDQAALETALVPDYIQQIPGQDGWGNTNEFRVALTDIPRVFYLGFRSPGRNDAFETDSYTAGLFDPTDYDQDIVFVDGAFARAPRGFQATT
jgi:general secretion pathway protein G